MAEIGEFDARTMVLTGMSEEIAHNLKTVAIMVESRILKHFKFLL